MNLSREFLRDVVLIDDPRVKAVPVQDSGEPLVLAVGASLVLARAWHGDQGCLVRQTVADKIAAAARLLPPGLHLGLAEGFRPLSRQRRVFTGYLHQLAEERHDLDSNTLHALASRHAAPPENNPPHSTGGAVDVVLLDADLQQIDMGSALDATPEESDGRCYTYSADISAEAGENRTLLIDTLTRVGLVNYPTEWWHWSYGDQYWAFLTNAPQAIYATAQSLGQVS